MKLRSNIRYILLILVFPFAFSCSEEAEKHLKIISTTDVHGVIFSVDPSSGSENRSSMAKVASYIKSFEKNKLLILDNGDNLQGTPSVYYSNFEDTVNEHLWASVLNYLEYDAVTVGNHDIEAGHGVYDRINGDYDFPMLSANAVDIVSEEPYFEPYTIIKRNGIKVIVFGLTTPGVPGWLPEVLYEGIEFRDMVETARKWMPEIKSHNPDVVIGLFHSGWDEKYGGGEEGSYLNGNASLTVAREVDGFDLIIIGHDHHIINRHIVNNSGDSVLILDGGSRAAYLSVADIIVKGRGGKSEVSISGEIIKLSDYEPDSTFVRHFNSNYRTIESYVNRPIGFLKHTLTSRDSYFGDCEFMDLIHGVQLKETEADISFAAPLSFDVSIDSGEIIIADMFDLYRFENMLYKIEMSGAEIDNYLEYSYGRWLNTIDNPAESVFLLDPESDRHRFLYNPYNFDSASGINYSVDLREANGEKVKIQSMSDGSLFDESEIYTVAVNSYRGSGGGGHLEYACDLQSDELTERILSSTTKDLRYYMMKWIEEQDTIKIECDNNWHIIPGNWIVSAKNTEYKKMFGEK